MVILAYPLLIIGRPGVRSFAFACFIFGIVGIAKTASPIFADLAVALSILLGVYIIFGEWMAAATKRATYILGRDGIASRVVLPRSHGLKMRGIYAMSNFAEVINLKSFWNWTLELFIRNTMNVKMFLSNSEHAVTSGRVDITLPFPTARGGIYKDLREKSIFQRLRNYHGSIVPQWPNIEEGLSR